MNCRFIPCSFPKCLYLFIQHHHLATQRICVSFLPSDLISGHQTMKYLSPCTSHSIPPTCRIWVLTWRSEYHFRVLTSFPASGLSMRSSILHLVAKLIFQKTIPCSKPSMVPQCLPADIQTWSLTFKALYNLTQALLLDQSSKTPGKVIWLYKFFISLFCVPNNSVSL